MDLLDITGKRERKAEEAWLNGAGSQKKRKQRHQELFQGR